MKMMRLLSILVFFAFLFGGMTGEFTQANVTGFSNDHIVIVLDASGSMTGSMADGVLKIDAAKKALKEVANTIPSHTRIGLLVFSAGNTEDDWVYPLGELNLKRLREAINLPEPSGSTPLGTYMKIGADRLLEERQKQFGYGTYRLLVVTDGEADDSWRTETYTPLIMARGIKIDVIGVAMAEDHTLATKVHTYRRADDPASLQKALRAVLGEIATERPDTTGDNAFAFIEPLPVEVASAAIGALSSSLMQNHPIGEEPAQTDSSQASSPAPESAGFGGLIIIVVGAIVAIFILIAFLVSL